MFEVWSCTSTPTHAVKPYTVKMLHKLYIYCVIVVVPDMKLSEIFLHITVHIKVTVTDKYAL